MLQDRGLLVERDGGWTLTGRRGDLPESIQGIIAARLDTLTDDEKAFIQDAAVIGRTAWIGAVCALTNAARGRQMNCCTRLERKQLLQRVAALLDEGETEFTFTHALTRDVAYSQIRRPTARRSTKPRRHGSRARRRTRRQSGTARRPLPPGAQTSRSSWRGRHRARQAGSRGFRRSWTASSDGVRTSSGGAALRSGS